ncbi:MarR family winged helix-turn-helix transcriptional regulator [Pseudooceanicola sp.]|jgi:DNA-binding MarR family transcriptional regulator|uniref:MarR family winged helix-turn-helix transcriptional regulator n=1 Tax=Pseudooceanicola sp. TaxID=1914328 RepID=UPI004057EB44
MADTPDPFAGDTDPTMGANRVWFNLLRIQRSMAPRIARVLKRHGIGDPIWYEILLELERAGPEGMLMSDLEGRLYTPQYALSRHAARLEEAGLIRSAPAPGRGRGKLLALTEDGVGLHARIWPVYREAIQSEIGSRLSQAEAYDLARVLIRLYP